MKKLCSFQIHFPLLIPTSLFLIVFSWSVAGNAAIKTAVSNTGQGWGVASNWSPSGVPQNGDEVVIPSGFTMSVKSNIYGSPFPHLVIKVYGALDFDPSGKIEMSLTGILNIYSGGSILSNGTSSELISIGGVIKFNGQIDGSVNGPRFASQNTGTSPNGFTSGVLAIKLLSFDCVADLQSVRVSWLAMHDHPADQFEVQRNSPSGWITLATIQAAGSLNTPNQYRYTDPSPGKGISLYRIRLVHYNAPESFSKTVAVSLSQQVDQLSVFPNPSASFVTVSWARARTQESVFIQVTNAAMGKVFEVEVPAEHNNYPLDVRRLAPGMYMVTVTSRSGFRESKTMLVN